MKAKNKKNNQQLFIRIGALVLVVVMLLGVVFSTVGTQSSQHDHDHYTEEELAALQALLDATGEDHSGHGHSADELEEMLDDVTEADATEGDAADDATEADEHDHDHE